MHKVLLQKSIFLLTQTRALLFSFILLLVLLTLPAVFYQNHVLLNLEPYPDGLLYVIPALNLVRGNGYYLDVTGLATLSSWVPPVYSLALVPVFLISDFAGNFVVTNLALAIGSCFFVWKAVETKTKNSAFPQIFAASAVLLLLLHSYFIQLITLPLSENMSVFLASLLLWLLTQKLSLKTIILFGLAGGLAVLTRPAVIPLVAGMFLGFILNIKQHNPQLFSKASSIVGLIFAAGILYYASVLGLPLWEVFGIHAEEKSQTELVFFSSSYLLPNIQNYGLMLWGSATRFLWFSFPYTSIGVTVLATIGWYHKKNDSVSLAVGLSVIAQLGLLLFFYTFDARYMISTLPGICFLAAIALEHYTENTSNKLIPAALFVLVASTLALSQLGSWKSILSQNILGNSNAWQYQALQALEQANLPSDSVIISALPGPLFEAYFPQKFTKLPLADSQEFMNEPEKIYALTFNDLSDQYEIELKNGQPVYITTAYFSNSPKFSTRWQEIQAQFELQKVHSGCFDACDIYQLRLKPVQ